MRERSGFMRPFHDERRWRALSSTISSLRDVKDSTELALCLQRLFQASGNTLKGLKNYGKEETDLEYWPFSGLVVFLDEIADADEKENFFETVLPFVISLALRAQELVPEDGIPVGTQQNETKIVLDRKLIACLLATGFLCAFPPVSDRTRTINFANFYAYFHREDYRSTQAAKLRCFIHYFERLKADWAQIDGHVTLGRQVIKTPNIPTLADWLACPRSLCPIIVDNENAIEDSGSYTLQVDFANRFIGGGVLGGGHVQEEIRFCVNPELVVSLLCMEAMDTNEAIIIKGTERFSSYCGYGKTFEFEGDFQDDSERDAEGNLQTTIAAIDAKSFRNASVESQYKDDSVLRELNKALAGFSNAQAAGYEFLPNAADHSEVSRGDHVIGRPVQPEGKSAFDAFLDSAVSKAFSDAAKTTSTGHNAEEGDIFIKAMRKSVLEVFQETPQKASVYFEAFLSPLTPKCMRLNLSGQSSPLVPSTPPSSPFAEGMGRGNGSCFQIPSVSCVAPSQLFNGAEVESPLSSGSFGDALYESLVACVGKTSSIAGSIAVAASSPVKAALVTKETFAKSPKDIGSPVKGGDDLVSFLSRTLCEGEVIKLNGKHSSRKGFVQDLATLLGSAKSKRAEESGTKRGLPNVRQKLSMKFAREEGSEESSACVHSDLEEFASKISNSILDTAIDAFVNSGAGTQRDAGPCTSAEAEDSDSAISDEGTATVQCRVADELIGHVLSAAIAEAAREMTRCTVEFESGDEKDTASAVSSDRDSELQELSDEMSCEQSSTSESASTDQGIDLENVDDIPEEFQKLAEELSETVVRSGMAAAVDCIMEELKKTRDPRDLQGERKLVNSKATTSVEVSSLANETELCTTESTSTGSLLELADNLSETTLTAGIQIAGARLRLRQSEAAVRPVATGNWGCGVFRGDPELKAVVQWLAASAAGSPALVYHTFGDKRLSRLLKVLSVLRSRDHKVCDVIRAILRFHDRMLTNGDEDCRPRLSSALLESLDINS